MVLFPEGGVGGGKEKVTLRGGFLSCSSGLCARAPFLGEGALSPDSQTEGKACGIGL